MGSILTRLGVLVFLVMLLFRIIFPELGVTTSYREVSLEFKGAEQPGVFHGGVENIKIANK